MKYLTIAAALAVLPVLPGAAHAGPTGIQLTPAQRVVQRDWWAKRAERKAERRMAARMAMPCCPAESHDPARQG